MRPRASFALGLVSLAASVSAQSTFSCTHTFEDGSSVDLSELQRKQNMLHYRAADADGRQYVMNVCSTEALYSDCLNTNSMICEFDKSGVYQASVAK